MSRNIPTLSDDVDTSLLERAGELADAVPDRLRAGLREPRATLTAMQESALARARAAGRAADDQVHDKPWRAIGVAAGVGVLIGLLMRRS